MKFVSYSNFSSDKYYAKHEKMFNKWKLAGLHSGLMDFMEKCWLFLY